MADEIKTVDDVVRAIREIEGQGGVVEPDGCVKWPNGQWGCVFCNGSGYEDYLQNEHPCRLFGHWQAWAKSAWPKGCHISRRKQWHASYWRLLNLSDRVAEETMKD